MTHKFVGQIFDSTNAKIISELMTAAAAYKAVPKATTNEAVPKVTAIHNSSVKEDVPKGGAKIAAPQGPAKEKATSEGKPRRTSPRRWQRR